MLDGLKFLILSLLNKIMETEQTTSKIEQFGGLDGPSLPCFSKNHVLHKSSRAVDESMSNTPLPKVMTNFDSANLIVIYLRRIGRILNYAYLLQLRSNLG